MGITYNDHLIDSGYYDITSEQEEQIWQQEREERARKECERLGIDPNDVCADGGVLAWMVVAGEAPPLVNPPKMPPTKDDEPF